MAEENPFQSKLQYMDCSINTGQLECAPSPKVVPHLHWKRVLDVFLIILALPLLLPLVLLIAMLIRAGSRGPVLFRQERVGYQSRRFMCFKFRTMFVGADSSTHQGHLQQLMKSNAPMQKMDAKGDPRIIRFGWLLRASGLDELPQLINVLRGEMSLVGPRPCVPYEYDQYLPWQNERFETVPGLTGLWQVSGKNRTTFVEMILLDIRYAKGKTLWWDLKIISLTVPVLVMQMLQARQIRKSYLHKVKASELAFTGRPTNFPGVFHAGDFESVRMQQK